MSITPCPGGFTRHALSELCCAWDGTSEGFSAVVRATETGLHRAESQELRSDFNLSESDWAAWGRGQKLPYKGMQILYVMQVHEYVKR